MAGELPLEKLRGRDFIPGVGAGIYFMRNEGTNYPPDFSDFVPALAKDVLFGLYHLATLAVIGTVAFSAAKGLANLVSN